MSDVVYVCNFCGRKSSLPLRDLGHGCNVAYEAGFRAAIDQAADEADAWRTGPSDLARRIRNMRATEQP